MAVPPLPPHFKSLGHYLKLASDFDARDPVISYWCRYHAVQSALAIDKSSPEAKNVIISLLSILEQKKKTELHDNEAVSNDDVAEAYIENYILKIFTWADGQDRAAVFNKNVVKAFYNAGVLVDVLANFNNGQISEEFEEKRKYAKWKAAYIHTCLKNGEIPKPGPLEDEDENFEVDVPPAPDIKFEDNNGNGSNPGVSNYSSYNPPVEPSVTLPSSSAGYVSYVQNKFEVEPPQPPPQSSGRPTLSVEQMTKAQKYCKFAGSSLNFDDIDGAIENLEKALALLKTGKDQ